MIAWAVFAGTVECGYCHQLIAAGDPVATRLNGKLLRCAYCAGLQGDQVDHVQIDAARHQLEIREAEARVLSPAPQRPDDGRFQPLGQIAASHVLPFNELPDDVQAADARSKGER